MITSKVTRFRGFEKSAFSYWLTLQTRFSDNDIYGHVVSPNLQRESKNNVQYYSFFDTTVNHFLFHRALGKSSFLNTQSVGLCVHSSCDYFHPIEYPNELEIGMFASKCTNSSIRYELGVFEKGNPKCAAHGAFVHVYVDSQTRRPVSIPENVKEAIGLILKHSHE